MVLDLGIDLIQDDLDLITSAMTLFSNEITFMGSLVNINLRGDTTQHSQVAKSRKN